jgi:hypothetical protein
MAEIQNCLVTFGEGFQCRGEKFFSVLGTGKRLQTDRQAWFLSPPFPPHTRCHFFLGKEQVKTANFFHHCLTAR